MQNDFIPASLKRATERLTRASARLDAALRTIDDLRSAGESSNVRERKRFYEDNDGELRDLPRKEAHDNVTSQAL